MAGAGRDRFVRSESERRIGGTAPDAPARFIGGAGALPFGVPLLPSARPVVPGGGGVFPVRPPRAGAVPAVLGAHEVPRRMRSAVMVARLSAAE